MIRLSAIPLFLCSLLATAAEAPGGKVGGTMLEPMSATQLLETAGGLLLVLLLIFGAAWLLKRYGQLPSGSKGLVRVVGGASLGPRERVVVVEVEGVRLLLGVAPGRVERLHLLSSSGEKGGQPFEKELSQAVEEQS
ncbi:flagellar biosynthetic protein FliO [Candidatus Endoriftia persephonae]|jgi:flagellar protein FliO/FliZ|uniref:Flagellar protein n=3 Tax=Gammaproteobacteria TaxID=1236 RepID=G2FHR3_9GAMM|nr:flagellar biosynthetic protein FliO [Candidatus Endoriftia persephone]EGW53707.1 flagellar biosynthesis protein FliO [endosymbiont of Tevnia jerichonana (vent Tica)]USF86921.1 flagellar biosynthetic protein FliO [Candidatus Endoriftia persephone]